MIAYNLPNNEAVAESSRRQQIELIEPKDERSATVRRPGVSIIVAAGSDNASGRDGDLVWHISADLRRFKALTMGAAVIMGRKTWLSLPNGALPGRRNMVLSSNPALPAVGAEVFCSLADALEAARTEGDVFIIGGGQVYRQALPFADQVYLTRIESECPESDTFFPALDPGEWRLDEASETLATKNGLCYRFETWTRR